MNDVFADELHPSSNPHTEAFQRAISWEFQEKYIDPIHQAFLNFWDSHVVETN